MDGMTASTISVIVPVYNAQTRLNRCIESLVNQTFKELEIILVNDGSKDGSGALCDQWAQKDSRITVIHQENGGVSKARNTGLDAARGKYVAFVDSDDHVSANIYELMIASMQINQADQVCCNAVNEFSSSTQEANHYFCDSVIRGEAVFSELILSLIRPEQEANKANLLQQIWNKLYSREIIERNNIRFDTELTYAEDWLFNVNYYRFANCVSFIPQHLYYYDRTTEGSLSKKFRWEGFDHSVKIRRYEKEWFPEICTDVEYHNLILQIQLHYLKLYTAYRGYAGFGKYARSLYQNSSLKEAYNSMPSVPKRYKFPQKCFQKPVSSAYISWAVLQTFTTAIKYYIKKMIRRS